MRTGRLLALSDDDVFITYSREDASAYAAGLAEELTKVGLSWFFDRLGTDASEELPPSLIRKLRGCRMLVVVGTAGAARSRFVEQEIVAFADANGTSRIVPIDLGGIHEAPWRSRIVGIAPEVETPGALATGVPSPAVVKRIHRSFGYTRSKDRLRRYTIGAAISLAVLVLGIAVAGLLARVQRDRARREADARRASHIVVLARGMANRDPLTASLLLAEVPETLQPDGAVATARDLLGRYVPRIVWRADSLPHHPYFDGNYGQGIDGRAFSRDGTRVAWAGPDGVVRLCDTAVGLRCTVLAQDGEDIQTVEFSADGQRILTTALLGPARLWPTDGRGVPVVQGPEAWAVTARFSSNGQRVVSGSDDGIVRVWNADGSGTPVVRRVGKEAVSAVAFSPDGSLVAATGDGVVEVWRADGSGKPVVFESSTAGVALAFSPDGRRIVTTGDDGRVQLYPSDGRGNAVVLGGSGGGIGILAFSADGSRVLALDDIAVRIWPVSGGAPVVIRLQTADGHGESQTAAFSPDGKQVVVGFGHRVGVWNADGTGEPLFLEGPTDAASGAVFGPDGREVLVTYGSGAARMWARTSPEEPIELPGPTPAGARYSPDGGHIAAAVDSLVFVWSAEGGQPRILQGHTGTVHGVTFSPDGSRLVTTAEDRTARVWPLDGRPPSVLGGHLGPVYDAAFAPDGSLIATVDNPNSDSPGDGVVRIWFVDGRPLTVLRGHQGPIVSAAWSPDGRSLVTGGTDKTVRIWRLDGGGPPRTLTGFAEMRGVRFDHDGARLLVVFRFEANIVLVRNADGSGKPFFLKGCDHYDLELSPDGRWLLGTSNGRPALCGVDGQQVRMLSGDGSEPSEFSRDGEYVLGSSKDGFTVWRTDGSGEAIVLPAPSASSGRHAAFSPDGGHVVTSERGHSTRVWTVAWKALRRHLRDRTAECLAPDQRIRYLDEMPEQAEARFTECELTHGRTPATVRTGSR